MSTLQIVLFVLAGVAAVVILRPLLFGGVRIAPSDAAAQIAAGTAVLIDVRGPDEWRAGVAAPAVLLPLHDLQGARREWAPFLNANKDKTLILYCASGLRSGTAAGLLREEGFRVANLGGFSRWTQAGLPVRDYNI